MVPHSNPGLLCNAGKVIKSSSRLGHDLEEGTDHNCASVCTFSVGLHLHISSVMVTVLGTLESGCSYPPTPARSHVQVGRSDLKVTATLWGKRSNCKGVKSAFSVLTFFAWMSRVDSWLTLCPVLLSVKWVNNAYLIRMLQELCKTFGKCFRNGKCCHSIRGKNFSFFWVFVSFFSSRLEPEWTSKWKLWSFQWPEKGGGC